MTTIEVTEANKYYRGLNDSTENHNSKHQMCILSSHFLIRIEKKKIPLCNIFTLIFVSSQNDYYVYNNIWKWTNSKMCFQILNGLTEPARSKDAFAAVDATITQYTRIK